MEDKRKIMTVTCIDCDETFSGLTEKQANRYMEMHKCKGEKNE